jgi:hypothetical protein
MSATCSLFFLPSSIWSTMGATSHQLHEISSRQRTLYPVHDIANVSTTPPPPIVLSGTSFATITPDQGQSYRVPLFPRRYMAPNPHKSICKPSFSTCYFNQVPSRPSSRCSLKLSLALNHMQLSPDSKRAFCIY